MRLPPRAPRAHDAAPACRPGLRALALPVATAIALLLPLADAHALALGRVTVLSVLGEPLRAEVEVSQITADEAASLRAAPAPAEAFRAAGIDRHPAINELRVTAERLSDGRFVLRLASDRVINEPVIDLLLEANWASGRLLRDYTLLFDPPANRAEAAPPAPVNPAQLPAAAASAEPASAPATAPAAPPPTPAVTGGAATERVTVRPGDTAGRIAAATKAPTVSLEQMLVAMLQANPQAFVGNNMNRLRAGAVLDLPSAESAASIEQQQARQTVRVQSQDFNEFRRRLAEQTAAAPATPAAPEAGRQATGRVEARVEDRQPAERAPDRLALSQGAVQGRSGASAPAAAAGEDRIARQRAEQDAATRLAELNRNLAELNRLGSAAGSSAGLASSPASGAGLAAALPGRTGSTPASGASGAATAPASAPAAEASQPAEAASAAASSAAGMASAPAETASATPAPAAPQAPKASEIAPAGAGLMQRLADLGSQPWPMAIGAAVIAGLAAMGGLLAWNRRRARSVTPGRARDDSRLADEDLDLADDDVRPALAPRAPANSGRSSMLYSPSQLDTSGEPDPLAEADVYLAYGRDLQAEEILQEALRASPDRLPVMLKLLEVFARRFDWDAFEPMARRAQALTGGRGPDWARVAELGRGLAPVGHPLFNGGGETPVAGNAGTAPSSPPPAPAAPAPAPAVPEGLSLDLDSFRMPAPPAQPAPPPAHDPEIDGPLEPGDAPARPAGSAAAAPMDFDLASLSLDLGEPGAGADPLETKLSLAEEFRSIGDTDGARSLAREVHAEASGELRARAERLLSELG